jgi:hypothetical protein
MNNFENSVLDNINNRLSYVYILITPHLLKPPITIPCNKNIGNDSLAKYLTTLLTLLLIIILSNSLDNLNIDTDMNITLKNIKFKK